MVVEQPYYDKNGKEIKEFALIKIFHFKGVNEQGKGRKNYYIYKWIRLKEWKGELKWVALHLMNDKNDYYHLRSETQKDGRLINVEVVQEP